MADNNNSIIDKNIRATPTVATTTNHKPRSMNNSSATAATGIGTTNTKDTNEPSNRILHQIDLLFKLKKQIDMIYKQLNLQTVCLQRFSRFHKFMKNKILLTTTDTIDKDIRVEYAKFYQNYRYWRKLSKKIDKQQRPKCSFKSSCSSSKCSSVSISSTATDLYEILYDLHENLTILDDETTNSNNRTYRTRSSDIDCDDDVFSGNIVDEDQTLLQQQSNNGNNNSNSVIRPITENDVVVELSEPNEPSSVDYLNSPIIDDQQLIVDPDDQVGQDQDDIPAVDDQLTNFEQLLTEDNHNSNLEDDLNHNDDLNYSDVINKSKQQQQLPNNKSNRTDQANNGGQQREPIVQYEAEVSNNNQSNRNFIKIKRIYRNDSQQQQQHSSSKSSNRSQKKKKCRFNASYKSSTSVLLPATLPPKPPPPSNHQVNNNNNDIILASPETTTTTTNDDNNTANAIANSIAIKMEQFDSDDMGMMMSMGQNNHQTPYSLRRSVRIQAPPTLPNNDRSVVASGSGGGGGGGQKSQIITYPCPELGCKFKGKSPSYLRYHQRVHINERPFKCEKCNKSYKDYYSLNAHQKVHLVRYCCTFDNCNANYSFKQTLRNHIAIVHTKKAPVLFCPWPNCDYSSQYKNNFERHCSLHTGNRPYPCPKSGCGNSYSEKKFLLKHLKIDHNLDDAIATVMISKANFRSSGLVPSSSSA